MASSRCWERTIAIDFSSLTTSADAAPLPLTGRWYKLSRRVVWMDGVLSPFKLQDRRDRALAAETSKSLQAQQQEGDNTDESDKSDASDSAVSLLPLPQPQPRTKSSAPDI
ncbi:hypothetical protein VPNG_09328 [Cytospora leucostoma]|uniref:Uncharacterized protein n=1 Tax=Cytospora leucostoma TaxID=1230097 RepID=A0A423VST3_9PEZI|nr:hypothetical protein VPNG_09328 [Cytospora leucostoma]